MRSLILCVAFLLPGCSLFQMSPETRAKIEKLNQDVASANAEKAALIKSQADLLAQLNAKTVTQQQFDAENVRLSKLASENAAQAETLAKDLAAAKAQGSQERVTKGVDLGIGALNIAGPAVLAFLPVLAPVLSLLRGALEGMKNRGLSVIGLA